MLLEIGDSMFAQCFQAKQPDRQCFNHVSIFGILTPSQDQGRIMSPSTVQGNGIDVNVKEKKNKCMSWQDLD